MLRIWLPNARCDYKDKIEDAAWFAARQAGADCEARLRCPDVLGGMLEVVCSSKRDEKKFKASFDRERKLLDRHGLTGARPRYTGKTRSGPLLPKPRRFKVRIIRDT